MATPSQPEPQTPVCAQALKEWDAQVQALAQGRFALVVRKGGIWEVRRGFEVRHSRFWLYPTFLHQNPLELRPVHADLLRPDPAPGRVMLGALAEVAAVWKVTDLGRARDLEGYQGLSAEALERRFRYKDKPWVHAVLLRVRRLSEPLTVAETKAYAGCVSWVELDEALSTLPSVPVLPEDRLEALRAELDGRLVG